ncbi:STE11-like transcription factor [Ascosphaera apis ARSEF 7405]|uniref:STE11-like transcription factor n=1 Tax=Ascosphaera apis ARSEF 7405 TaxID=392613 RepID=A0A162IDD2_9EURO|nr:STE11-like transcription factor [Ascosphaera apis ARSEF 7405]
MAMNHPSTPPSSSDGDLQGSLGRYAAHTPSSVNPNFYDLQVSPYEYFGSEVGDQFNGVSSLNYGNSMHSYTPDTPIYQPKRQEGHLLTPTATPDSKSTVTSQRARPSTRSKTTKAGKSGMPELSQPLSILTKHMTHVPLRDMEAHVHRPLEVRLQEVEKKNGKIARPMNSFMLYRSAYAERTKEWCSKNNHQIVSSVSGQSWPQETPEIREKYENLAFAPNKNNIAPKRKRTPELGDSDFESTDGDFNGYKQYSEMSRLACQRRMHKMPYGMSHHYQSTPEHNYMLSNQAHMETWSPAPQRDPFEEYQRALLKSQLNQEMMRSDAYALSQYQGHEFNFTVGLTPSGHRQTLEAPVHDSHHFPSPFTNAVDPQLLEYRDDSSLNGINASNALDPYLLSYSNGGQMSPTTTTLSDPVSSPLDATYPSNECLKFGYENFNFPPDPFPIE